MFSDPQTLKPPNSGKPRDSRLKFYEGSITVSEFVKDSDRDKLDVESIRRGVSPGITCLSVTKVPPNCDVHISPSLGDHPVTPASDESFSWEENKQPREGERVYSLYNSCHLCINGRKHLASSRQMFTPCKTHVSKLLSGTYMCVY